MNKPNEKVEIVSLIEYLHRELDRVTDLAWYTLEEREEKLQRELLAANPPDGGVN